jgi:hypothetical protein
VYPTDGPDFAGAGALPDDLGADPPLPTGGPAPAWESSAHGALSIDALIERNRKRLAQLRKAEAATHFKQEPQLAALMA